jgi:hypothetical protein
MVGKLPVCDPEGFWSFSSEEDGFYFFLSLSISATLPGTWDNFMTLL